MLIQTKISIKMKFNLNLKEIMISVKAITYTTLVVTLIVGFLFSTIITILPADVLGFGSTKVSYLGYVAHCSFAPWSTLISLSLVGIGVFFLIKLVKYLKSNNISFVNLLKMYTIATIVVFLVSACFPVVLFVIGAYILIKLIEYLKPKFEERWLKETEARN
jgi:hypothetical protein